MMFKLKDKANFYVGVISKEKVFMPCPSESNQVNKKLKYLG